MVKKVIINGDDFGYSPGVNKGIITAFQEGILTSTTALSNCLQENDSLQDLSSSQNKPAIGIGVHLNLTLGKPLVPEVWPQKEFVRPYKGTNSNKEWQGSVWGKYFSSFAKESIKREFEKQMSHAEEILGSLDHLDSHHGVASYAAVREVYLTLAHEFHIALRPTSPLSENAVYGGEFIVDNNFSDEVRPMQIKTVDRVIMQYFHQLNDPEEVFCNYLEKIKEGELVEFMFHPSIDDSQGAWRMTDLKILTSKKVLQRIVDLKIELTTYAASY